MTVGDFIGRDHELGCLSRLLDQATDRTPTTVLLAGDAGVGKTRLLAEFADRARARGVATFVLRGECVDLADGVIPYAPLVWALREFVREHGGKARNLAGPGWDGLGGLISDFTGQLPDPRFTGVLDTPKGVYGMVQQVLRFLGDQKPVMLVFENMHWADQSTLDLVSYLTRGWRDERILLICSHRSGLEQGHPLRARLAEPNLSRAVERMDLKPFTEAELLTFLNARGEADLDQVRRIHRLSEGNAFFAEELLLAAELAPPDGAGVPESVQELMLQRINLLSEPARKVLSMAATAARRVSHALLLAVCNLTEEELEGALRECLDRGLLVVDAANDAYVFRHALLRETVYENELPPTRVRRHAAMAEAITSNTEFSLAEDVSSAVELAHHWWRAGRKPEALVSALRAGAMTARLRAFPEAETHYRRALDLWPQVDRPQERARVPRERVLAEAADAARWAGHVTGAVELITAAILEVDAEARPRLSGELHERLGSYQWEAGDADGSARAYREALLLLAQEPPEGATDVRVMAGLAGVEVREGRYSEGLRAAESAAELARAVGAVAEEGRALSTAGVAATMLGRAPEGVTRLRAALAIAEEAENLEDLFRAYANLGFALEYAGEPAEAAKTALAGLERARGFGLAFARQGRVLANNAGVALLLLGEWERAAQLLDNALADHPSVEESAYLRLTLAEIELARGDFAAVDRLLAQVRDQRPTDPRFVGALRGCAAELALWRSHPAQALDAAVDALAEVGAGENVAEELRLCAVGLRAAADLRDSGAADAAVAERVAALATRAAGYADRIPALPETPVLCLQCVAERDRAEGRDNPKAWAEVAQAWADLKRPYPTAYAHRRQAAALRAQGKADEAALITREALEVVTRLGARPLQRELEKAAGLRPDTPSKPPLKGRQLEAAQHVARGRSNAEIAGSMGITVSAVARTVFNACETLRKLGHPIRNRTDLAIFVREHKLLGQERDTEKGDPT